MASLPLGKPKKKAPKTPLTKTLLFGIIKVQRARTPELIFVHVRPDTPRLYRVAHVVRIVRGYGKCYITIDEVCSFGDKCFYPTKIGMKGKRLMN